MLRFAHRCLLGLHLGFQNIVNSVDFWTLLLLDLNHVLPPTEFAFPELLVLHERNLFFFHCFERLFISRLLAAPLYLFSFLYDRVQRFPCF